jgi:ubiquinone/menaquinone biosynthesis C-methylase UbiE
MEQADIRHQWEGAAPGWAQWEATVATWMEPATETMLAMAGVDAGARVLDLACGAGSQTLRAARRVGAQGHVVASDIAEAMLHHVRENARAAALTNVTTLAGAAEDLDVAAASFDAVICRLGLTLFVAPAQALAAVRRALRPGGIRRASRGAGGRRHQAGVTDALGRSAQRAFQRLHAEVTLMLGDSHKEQ